jgi:hypothetical protein
MWFFEEQAKRVEVIALLFALTFTPFDSIVQEWCWSGPTNVSNTH